MSSPDKIGFKFHSLNALRFFAFFLVYLKHINGAIPEDSVLSFFKVLTDGGAVEFFFVLGGFLFTFLLIKEKEQNQQFSFIRFYAKRILRTWPLFFLIIGFAYLSLYGAITLYGDKGGYELMENIGLIEGNGYWPSWKHSILFLENYKMWEHHLILDSGSHWFPILSPLVVTWSLCIQEHFYLVWPIFIMFIPNKHLPKAMIGVIILSILTKFGIYFYFNEKVTSTPLQLTHDLLTYLDLYGIGGLLGFYSYFNYRKIIEINNRIPHFVKLLFVVLLVGLLKLDEWFYTFHYITLVFWNLTIGLALTTLIFFFIPSESRFKFSERSIFSRIGKMSYSLYLTHLTVIHIILRQYQNHEIQVSSLFNLAILIISTFIISLIVSSLTFNIVEKPFLNLKHKLRGIKFLQKIR